MPYVRISNASILIKHNNGTRIHGIISRAQRFIPFGRAYYNYVHAAISDNQNESAFQINLMEVSGGGCLSTLRSTQVELEDNNHVRFTAAPIASDISERWLVFSLSTEIDDYYNALIMAGGTASDEFIMLLQAIIDEINILDILPDEIDARVAESATLIAREAYFTELTTREIIIEFQRADRMQTLIRCAPIILLRRLAVEVGNGVRENPVRYTQTGAIRSVIPFRRRYDPSEDQIIRLMRHIESGLFPSSFFCSTFIIYCYAIAFLRLTGRGEVENVRLPIHLDVFKTSPSQLCQYLHDPTNSWELMNYRRALPT